MLNLMNSTLFSHIVFAFARVKEELANVVVAKAQYRLIPSTSENLSFSLETVHDEGAETILVTDEAFGSLNQSSVRSESDLAPYKPKCDVIVIGSAHSPSGALLKTLMVGVDIDARGTRILSHRLLVHGRRYFMRRDAVDRGAAFLVWAGSFGAVKAPQWYLSETEPFLKLPLRYEEAFGGDLKVYAGDECAQRLHESDKLTAMARDRHPEGIAAPVAHRTCRVNPFGLGFVEDWHARATRAGSYPAPRIEAVGSPLSAERFDALARGTIEAGAELALLPQGFGAISKSWQPRLRLAGTYDEIWRTQYWPYSPPDFDLRYWNGAHPSMQSPHLRGGESIVLTNLLPSGHPGSRREALDANIARFRLPDTRLVLSLTHRTGSIFNLMMPIDTLTIDLDEMTVSTVWRTHVPDGVEVAEATLLAVEPSRARPIEPRASATSDRSFRDADRRA